MHARCPACGDNCLFVTEPIYDGFTKTGESARCTGCGEMLDPSTLEASTAPERPDVFGDVIPEARITIEGQDERPEFCRYCIHYVTHAFTQRCGLTFEEVEATHSCDKFEPADAS